MASDLRALADPHLHTLRMLARRLSGDAYQDIETARFNIYRSLERSRPEDALLWIDALATGAVRYFEGPDLAEAQLTLARLRRVVDEHRTAPPADEPLVTPSGGIRPPEYGPVRYHIDHTQCPICRAVPSYIKAWQREDGMYVLQHAASPEHVVKEWPWT